MPEVTTPVYYRLLVYRGANLQISFVYYDEDDEPVNLVGCLAYLRIAHSDDELETDPIFAVSSVGENPPLVLGGASGSFDADVPYADLADLSPTGEGREYEEYAWNLVFQYADGTTREIMLYGPCEVI